MVISEVKDLDLRQSVEEVVVREISKVFQKPQVFRFHYMRLKSQLKQVHWARVVKETSVKTVGGY